MHSHDLPASTCTWCCRALPCTIQYHSQESLFAQARVQLISYRFIALWSRWKGTLVSFHHSTTFNKVQDVSIRRSYSAEEDLSTLLKLMLWQKLTNVPFHGVVDIIETHCYVLIPRGGHMHQFGNRMTQQLDRTNSGCFGHRSTDWNVLHLIEVDAVL